MDTNERVTAASAFLLQSPPGEINDVLLDVRMVIDDDEALQSGLGPALRSYNTAQLIAVDVVGVDHQIIISDASCLVPTGEEGTSTVERYVDPRSKTSFEFDHIRLEASNPEPYEPNSSAEPFRSELEKAALVHIADHYYNGTAAVVSQPLLPSEEPATYVIQIVGNKYNPSNYWSGRWRSAYVLDPQAGTLTGKIELHVHYYEQGNVQLITTHEPQITVPELLANELASSKPSAASKVLAIIESEEKKYQLNLTDAYEKMKEQTFKNLRRALPMTRQKLDWDKVMGYKLGAELTASKGVFTPEPQSS